jgi:hypothetical protein
MFKRCHATFGTREVDCGIDTCRALIGKWHTDRTDPCDLTGIMAEMSRCRSDQSSDNFERWVGMPERDESFPVTPGGTENCESYLVRHER